MKNLLLGLLMGAMVGAGTIWYLTVMKAENRTIAKAEKARESLQASGEQAKQALANRLEALELRAEDIQKELAEKGSVVRRKARDIGEAAADTAIDARATATIKAKLAADPELSALRIAVATTAGLVTLSGTVASPELIGKAMALALETDGVREVVSTLQVK